MSGRSIHQLLVERERGQTDLGSSLPVEPKTPDVPVLVMDRWNITSGMLTKRYEFRQVKDRLQFVIAMLEYEEKTQHNAVIIIDEGTVIMKLVTKNINRITELDREYAMFADVVFKDLVYY